MNSDVGWETRGESFEVNWMAGDGETSIVCYCRNAQGRCMSILQNKKKLNNGKTDEMLLIPCVGMLQ